MKKYAVFAYDHYYPLGGWNDLSGTFESREEADAFAKEKDPYYDCVHVVDLTTCEEIS